MMTWAVIGLFLLFLLISYIIIQGTRAAIAWRQAAEAGDVKVIGDIVQDAINAWRSMKRPKPVPVEVWRGIQSMEMIEVDTGFVRVSCQAESEYKMVNGNWVEFRNPLQDGMAILARAADMIFYEMPHFRPDHVQIDVYTSFRESDGAPRRDCILTAAPTRDQARQVDWEEWTAEEIVDALGGRYSLGERGQPLPVDVEPARESGVDGGDDVTEAAEARGSGGRGR